MASEDSDRPLAPQDATQFFVVPWSVWPKKHTPHIATLLGGKYDFKTISISSPNGKFIFGFATLLSLSLIPFIAFYIHQHLYLHGDATCTYMFNFC
jgi:hypothetical protein